MKKLVTSSAPWWVPLYRVYLRMLSPTMLQAECLAVELARESAVDDAQWLRFSWRFDALLRELLRRNGVKQ